MMNSILDFLNDDDAVQESVHLDSREDATAIFLSAMEDVCTPEELETLVYESANMLELYGIIDDHENVMSALEAAIPSKKKTVIIQTKKQIIDKATKNATMRLARAAGDPHYAKYKMYRDKMLDERQKVYDKWLAKGRREAKRVLTGQASAASAIKDTRGKQVEDKIKEAIAKTDANGRNKKAIKD